MVYIDYFLLISDIKYFGNAKSHIN